MSFKSAKATPYNWPFDGHFAASNSALLVIDMQRDFCSPSGYVTMMGYDVTPMRNCIAPIKSVLTTCRQRGITIVYTREGHLPDLSDLPENKRWRSKKIGAEIGTEGPLGRILVRGEKGWGIVDELTPTVDDIIIDKPGKGAFYSTELELILRTKGIRNLILTGVTTDVCVHTTMREANDRGFECLLMSDCTAATDSTNHDAALRMTEMSGGIFGTYTTSAELLAALS